MLIPTIVKRNIVKIIPTDKNSLDIAEFFPFNLEGFEYNTQTGTLHSKPIDPDLKRVINYLGYAGKKIPKDYVDITYNSSLHGVIRAALKNTPVRIKTYGDAEYEKPTKRNPYALTFNLCAHKDDIYYKKPPSGDKNNYKYRTIPIDLVPHELIRVMDKHKLRYYLTDNLYIHQEDLEYLNGVCFPFGYIENNELYQFTNEVGELSDVAYPLSELAYNPRLDNNAALERYRRILGNEEFFRDVDQNNYTRWEIYGEFLKQYGISKPTGFIRLKDYSVLPKAFAFLKERSGWPEGIATVSAISLTKGAGENRVPLTNIRKLQSDAPVSMHLDAHLGIDGHLGNSVFVNDMVYTSEFKRYIIVSENTKRLKVDFYGLRPPDDISFYHDIMDKRYYYIDPEHKPIVDALLAKLDNLQYIKRQELRYYEDYTFDELFQVDSLLHKTTLGELVYEWDLGLNPNIEMNPLVQNTDKMRKYLKNFSKSRVDWLYNSKREDGPEHVLFLSHI